MTVCETLKLIRPHIFAKGGDRTKDEIKEDDRCIICLNEENKELFLLNCIFVLFISSFFFCSSSFCILPPCLRNFFVGENHGSSRKK